MVGRGGNTNLAEETASTKAQRHGTNYMLQKPQIILSSIIGLIGPCIDTAFYEYVKKWKSRHGRAVLRKCLGHKAGKQYFSAISAID